MIDIEEAERLLELRRALRRWVAAIREALLNELKRDPSKAPFGDLSNQEFEIVKRDLNQCERMLGNPYIDLDPVLEIWRRDRQRAGVLWFNFAPADSE